MNATFFSTYMLPAVLIIIMFGIGLSLEKKDFKNIFIYPRPIIIGLVAQMVLLPIVAFLLIGFTNLSPVLKVGFVLIAACPGGTAANLVAHILKGNLALCVSLTAINSTLILFTLPLILNLGLILFLGEARDITLTVSDTILKIFYTTLVPVFAGLLLRERRQKIARRLEEPMKYIMTVLLLLVFAGIIFSGDNRTQSAVMGYLNLVPWALGLNLLSMAAGYFFARFFGLKNQDNYTISIQVGLQNSALAIFVAESLLQNKQMAMVAIIYSSFTFFTTAFFGYLAKRYGVKKQKH